MSIAISIHHLKKYFNRTEVFHDFSMDIEESKVTVIFGPNGSGKSTLLNILAGITPKDGGGIDIKNTDPFYLSYIFQNYRESLLPWRNIFDNIAFPLEVQKKEKNEIREKIEELQRLFTIQLDWERYPYELSGGQQQIVAFMRALVTNPRLLFIDEPFSALDYENNLRLRELLQTYYLAFRPTVLLITHNIEEAVHLADTIVVVSKKPTRVLASIDNPLPFPRTIQSLKTEAFHQVKDDVLSIFQQAADV